MADKFSNFAVGLTSPGEDGAVIVPSDAADLASASRFLMVETEGVVRFSLLKHGAGVYMERTLKAGVCYPLRCRRIWATGTTALGVAAFW